MIPNGEGHETMSDKQWRWHCLAVKKLLALLRKITVIFIVWISFIHSLEQKKNFDSHKNVCQNEDFCI